MTLFAGSSLKLFIKIGGEGSEFQPLGGLVSKTVSIRSPIVQNAALQQTLWRDAIEEAGENTIRLSGTGVFEGRGIAQEILGLALQKQSRPWRIEIAGLGVLEGSFVVTRFDLTGPYAGVEQFSIALQSSGEIEFTGEI